MYREKTTEGIKYILYEDNEDRNVYFISDGLSPIKEGEVIMNIILGEIRRDYYHTDGSKSRGLTIQHYYTLNKDD